jgi:hypothetical protein
MNKMDKKVKTLAEAAKNLTFALDNLREDEDGRWIGQLYQDLENALKPFRSPDEKVQTLVLAAEVLLFVTSEGSSNMSLPSLHRNLDKAYEPFISKSWPAEWDNNES